MFKECGFPGPFAGTVTLHCTLFQYEFDVPHAELIVSWIPDEADPTVDPAGYEKSGVNVIVPEAAPDAHVPDTTFTASLVPPPATCTWYPTPLVVSIPVGHGASVTVAALPPVNAPGITCSQFSDVLA